MADETTNGAETGASPAGAETTENMVPQSRFNEVNNAYKTMRAELETLKAATQAAETRRLEEQQEWQQLAEQRAAEIERLKEVETQYTSVNATLDALLEARMSELSEDAQAMVPRALSKQEQLNWIADNHHRLTRPAAPPNDAGTRGDSAPFSNVRLSSDQEAALARAQAVDPTMTRARYMAALVKLQGD